MTSATSVEGEPKGTARGWGLAVGIVLLSLFCGSALVVYCLLSVQIPLSSLWHRFQTGGTGMWVLLPSLPLGLALALTIGVLQMLRHRVAGWPLFVVPILGCLVGLLFERLGAQHAFDVVSAPGIGPQTSARIFAEAVGEFMNPRAFGFLCAGLLLGFGASIAALRALRSAETFTTSRAFAFALGACALTTLIGVDYASRVGRFESQAVLAASLLTAQAALLCALVALTTPTPDFGSDRRNRTNALWHVGGFAVGAQLCLASFWEALAQSVAFGAIGGEAVADEEVASRLQGALVLIDWCRSVLPWLAIVPLLVTLLVVVALRDPSNTSSARAGLWWSSVPIVLGVLGLVGARYCTHEDLARCVGFAARSGAAEHEFVTAVGGKPQRLGSIDSALWVGKESLVLRGTDERQTQLAATSRLLEADCSWRLAAGDHRVRRLTVALDAALVAQHLQCLMVGLQKLKPALDGTWANAPSDSLPIHTWLLRWPQAALPAPYASLALRVVELKLGVAAQPAAIHLELQATHWELRQTESRARIEGELAERVARLRQALGGRAAVVSIAAAAQVPAPDVLNAALATTDAGCEPQLWLSGYSSARNSALW